MGAACGAQKGDHKAKDGKPQPLFQVESEFQAPDSSEFLALFGFSPPRACLFSGGKGHKVLHDGIVGNLMLGSKQDAHKLSSGPTRGVHHGAGSDWGRTPSDASSPYEQAHHYHTRHPAAKPTVETRRVSVPNNQRPARATAPVSVYRDRPPADFSDRRPPPT